jgi:dienelactone hydrolase
MNSLILAKCQAGTDREKNMKRIFAGILVCVCMHSLSHAAIQEEEITYSSGDTTLKGFLAYDDAVAGQRPGVLVVHEWWGHNDYARKSARMLSGMAYTAYAVDMYGDGKLAQHPDDAGKFAGEVKKNMAVAEARFRAALELLQNQPTVDSGRVAAIGYCFGGGIVLEMARRGVDLDGVVSYHGMLATDTPAEKGKVKARVLVFNGAADPFVPPAQVKAFEKEMSEAGVTYMLINYPGVKHSFTVADADKRGQQFDLPLEYNKKADSDSWARTERFFDSLFQ